MAKAVTIAFADMLAMQMQVEHVSFQCLRNLLTGLLTSSARWSGVSTRKLAGAANATDLRHSSASSYLPGPEVAEFTTYQP